MVVGIGCSGSGESVISLYNQIIKYYAIIIIFLRLQKKEKKELMKFNLI